MTLNRNDSSSGGRSGQDYEFTQELENYSLADQKKAAAWKKKMQRIYPPISEVAPSSTKMYLSTGKASVHRQVDCWMSFEEYDNLTRQVSPMK